MIISLPSIVKNRRGPVPLGYLDASPVEGRKAFSMEVYLHELTGIPSIGDSVIAEGSAKYGVVEVNLKDRAKGLYLLTLINLHQEVLSEGRTFSTK